MSRNALLFSALISICFVNQARSQDVALLTPTELLKLIPKRIKGFQEVIDPKALEMKIGHLRYTLCEKNFNNRKQVVKILLFDFEDADIMYDQATKKWGDQIIVVSDSVVEQPVLIRNCKGWESFNKGNKTAQIFLGIYDRFFLTVTGENIEPDELKKILDAFPFEEFPKGSSN